VFDAVSDDDRGAGGGEPADESPTAADAPAAVAGVADAPAVAPDPHGAVLMSRVPREHARLPLWFPKALALTGVGVLVWLALYGFLGQVRQLLIWLLISLFLSFALEPAVNWLARHGWKRGLGTGAVLLVLLLLGIGLVASMVPLVITQIQDLIDKVPGWLRDLNSHTHTWFGFTFSTKNLVDNLDKIKKNLGSYASDIAKNLLHVVGTVVGLIFQLLTIALFTFYLVADGPRFRRTVCSFLSPERQRRVLTTWEVAIEKTGGYLYSRLLLALCSGIYTFIALSVLGVPFAAALALWMGLVSQFVPVVGTYIAMLLPILVALGVSPATALVVLILFGFYQQIENYLLSPKITARTMQLHPAVAFASAIVGGSILGPIGAFLALPAAAIVQAVLSTYMERYQVIESDLTSDSPPPAPPKRQKARVLERLYRRVRARRAPGAPDATPAVAE
jgi:predicted PurR-regulated permease PerM